MFFYLNTGIRQLNQSCIGDFQGNELILITGVPSSGKTTFIEQLIRNCAEDEKQSLYITMEGSVSDMIHRFGVDEAGVDRKQAWRGTLDVDDELALATAFERIAKWPVVALTPTTISCVGVREAIEACPTRPRIVFVDYVSLMKEGATAATIGLAAIAKDLNIPIVAACHMPRKPGEPPHILHLDADIRSVADAIFHLHRFSDDDYDVEFPATHLNVYKSGKCLSRVLCFDPERRLYQLATTCDPEKSLYRLEPHDAPPRAYSAAELDAMKFCEVPTTTSLDAHTPCGQWYCESEDCVVREVVVSLKLYGEPMPLHMACPACGSTMSFHHYVETRTLLAIVPDSEAKCRPMTAEELEAWRPS